MKILPTMLETVDKLPNDVTAKKLEKPLQKVDAELEIGIIYSMLEEDRKSLGKGWDYVYFSKVMFPYTLVQPENEYVIAKQAFTGGNPRKLNAHDVINLGKIGTMLKGLTASDFANTLPDSTQVIDELSTKEFDITGIIDEDFAHQFVPFIHHSQEVSPPYDFSGVIPFVLLEPTIDNASSLRVAKQYQGLMAQLKDSYSKVDETREFYQELTDIHLLNLDKQISALQNRLSNHIEIGEKRINRQSETIQTDLKTEIFKTDLKRSQKELTELKRFVPLFQTLQHQIMQMNNLIENERTYLMDVNLQPEKCISRVNQMDKALDQSIQDLQSARRQVRPLVKDISTYLRSHGIQIAEEQFSIEGKYQQEIEVIKQDTQDVISEQETIIERLQSLTRRIQQQLVTVLPKIELIKERIVTQSNTAEQFKLDKGLFNVTSTTDLLYVPVYVAKFEKANSRGTETSYIVYPPMIWNPKSDKKLFGKMPKNQVISSVTGAFQAVLNPILNSSRALQSEVDEVARKYNLLVIQEANQYLIQGLNKLEKSAILPVKQTQKVSETWQVSAKYCPHCNSAIISREGFCKSCGKQIMISVASLR